jgi:membrane protein DedA with SNARE-associated domain
MVYNILSAFCWAVVVTGAGYLLGMIPWIQEHIGLIILFIAAFILATIIVIIVVSAHGLLVSKKGNEERDEEP